MGIKSQLNKLKDNWLLILFVLILLVLVSGGGLIGSLSSGSQKMAMTDGMYFESSNSAYSRDSTSNFAPGEEERKIVTTGNMNVVLERGEYTAAEEQLYAITSSTDSFILNTNVRTQGEGSKSYRMGSYQIKVDSTKYNSVVKQLEQLGEVKSFTENERDITGSYTKTSIEIEVETEKLKRYQNMYSQANLMADKINLNDKIYEQERKIKYLEDSLTNMDQKVIYSTINLNMNEEQPNYYRVSFAKFSNLVKTIVGSINTILYVIFAVAPWLLTIGIIWFIVRLFRKKKEPTQV